MIKLARLSPVQLPAPDTAPAPTPTVDVGQERASDPLRAVLMESLDKNRGVTLYANGATIAMVVTALDTHYVMGRSQQANRIVVRIDQIDGVSAVF